MTIHFVWATQKRAPSSHRWIYYKDNLTDYYVARSGSVSWGNILQVICCVLFELHCVSFPELANKNFANIQPSKPHACSTTHIPRCRSVPLGPCPHYVGEIWKRNNRQSLWICVWGEPGQRNLMIIVTLRVSKSSIFKMFSVHSKTQRRRFQTPPVRRALFSWQTGVDSRPNRRNKAVFSNFSSVVCG